MRRFEINFGALVAWSCGAVFLVPASMRGFDQAFGFGVMLSWSGAVAVTMMGSLGVGLARNGASRFESLVGVIVAAGGLLLAVASDSASLWERLRQEHRAPAEVAGASSEAAEAVLAGTAASIASVKESARFYAEQMAMEERSGKGARWTAAKSQHDSLVAELAELEARRIADTQALAQAQREAASAQADSYWLAGEGWGRWALLGFAALFEALLVFVGFLVARPAKAEAVEAVAAPRQGPAPRGDEELGEIHLRVRGDERKALAALARRSYGR